MKEVNFHQFNFGSVKWTDMFESEEELIKKLDEIDIVKFKANYCKGWQFVEGFQKSLKTKGELSPKQLTQLKRIAKEIYTYHIRGYGN